MANIYVQLEQALEQYDLRDPIFYFEHENQTAVCLLVKRNGTALARGVSVCSPFDHYDKEVGRAIAIGRALRAIKKMDTTEEINPNRFTEHKSFYPRNKEIEAHQRLDKARISFGYKSCYLPRKTRFELWLVDKKQFITCQKFTIRL